MICIFIYVCVQVIIHLWHLWYWISSETDPGNWHFPICRWCSNRKLFHCQVDCQKVYSVAPTHAVVRRDHQTHLGRSVSNFIPCLQIKLENPGSLGLVGFTTFVSEMVYHCNRFIVTGLTTKRGRRWQRTFRLAKDWNPKSTILSGAKMFTKVSNSRHSHA